MSRSVFTRRLAFRAALTRAAAFCVLATSLMSCGTSVQHSDRYVCDFDNPQSSFSKTVDRFHIRLLVSGTYSRAPGSRDSVFHDSVGFVRPPYTLHVSTSFYGVTNDVAKIQRITMQVGSDEPVVLHGDDAPTLRLAYEPWLDHAVSANLRFPLGNKLPFARGEAVAFEVHFVPPEAERAHSIRTVFRGTSNTHEMLKVEMLLQGS
ncbi:MAG: hypothetical protein AAGD86_09275 [Pseudomonadota bacterium]